MLEGRIGDGPRDHRIGHRVNCCIGLARLARPGEHSANVRRKGGSAPIDSNACLGLGRSMLASGRKIECNGANSLGLDLVSAAKSNVEIWKYNLALGTDIAAQRSDGEAYRRDDIITRFLAKGAKLGDGRSNIDGARITTVRRIKQRYVASAGRNPRNRAVAAHRIDTTPILLGNIAGVAAGTEQSQSNEGGKT